jgi:hypothetical protein
VLGFNPVILLVKLPVPVPSEVWLSLVVGLADVLQHTPLAVTDAPPLEVTFPPLDALLNVIEDTVVVVTVGVVAVAVQVTVRVSVPVLSAASREVTVIMFSPL